MRRPILRAYCRTFDAKKSTNPAHSRRRRLPAPVARPAGRSIAEALPHAPANDRIQIMLAAAGAANPTIVPYLALAKYRQPYRIGGACGCHVQAPTNADHDFPT